MCNRDVTYYVIVTIEMLWKQELNTFSISKIKKTIQTTKKNIRSKD